MSKAVIPVKSLIANDIPLSNSLKVQFGGEGKTMLKRI